MAAVFVRWRLILLKSLILTKHDLQTAATWEENLKPESNHTPKFRTLSVGVRLLPKMSIGKQLAILFRWDFEPKRINSVLSGLSLSLFAAIQL